MSTKRTSRVMLAIGASRVLGLVREVLLNTVLGAGKELDALIAAFRIPNLLRDLFAEGALSTAFVTTFSQKLAKEGKAAAYRLANNVNTLLFIVLTAIVGVGILEADFLVHFFNPGFAAVPGKSELTIELTRILFPFILFQIGGRTMMAARTNSSARLIGRRKNVSTSPRLIYRLSRKVRSMKGPRTMARIIGATSNSSFRRSQPRTPIPLTMPRSSRLLLML